MREFIFSENEVFHNAKSKFYPNGTVSTTVCNKAIFKDENFESIEKLRVTDRKPQNKNNDVRSDSVQRAVRKMFDIGMMNCNAWEYFVTLTLDPEKVDRTNPEMIHKVLNNFLKNMVQRNNFKYVLVPEFHKDNEAIHFHLLCCGDLNLIDSGTVLSPGYNKPVRLETALKKCSDVSKLRTVYNIPQWSYGFSTAVKLIGDIDNVIKYIVKYITKDSKKIFGNFYLAGGKNLVRNVPYKVHDFDFDNLDTAQYDIP